MVTTAQLEALYLGSDAGMVPAVATFDHWYGIVFPGHQPDIYALYAWASAELFVQAVKAAGTPITRAGILAALGKITTFDADGLLAPADPATRTPPTCFLLAHVVDGQWKRIEPASGFDCSGSYFTAPGTTDGRTGPSEPKASRSGARVPLVPRHRHRLRRHLRRDRVRPRRHLRHLRGVQLRARAIGMVAAYTYWALHVPAGWPTVPAALVVVLVLAPLAGAVIDAGSSAGCTGRR